MLNNGGTMERTFDIDTVIFVVSLKDINCLCGNLSKEELIDSKMTLIEKSYDLIEYVTRTEIFDYNYEDNRQYTSQYLCNQYPVLEHTKHNIDCELLKEINLEVGEEVLVSKPNKNYNILKKRKNTYLRTIKD